MRSFPNPGLADSRTRTSGSNSGGSGGGDMGGGLYVTLEVHMCVLAHSLSWLVMLGRSRDACEPRVSARRVCENVYIYVSQAQKT